MARAAPRSAAEPETRSQLLGYACLHGSESKIEDQRNRLTCAGAARVFEDVIASPLLERPGLEDLIASAWPGDQLCVVRLDRLGQCLEDLLATVETLQERQIGLLSIEDGLDTRKVSGEVIFLVFEALMLFQRRCAAGHASAIR